MRSLSSLFGSCSEFCLVGGRGTDWMLESFSLIHFLLEKIVLVSFAPSLNFICEVLPICSLLMVLSDSKLAELHCKIIIA